MEYYIEKVTSDDYGHCNYLDVVHLSNGAVITIGAEGICLHKSERDFDEGEQGIDCISFPDDQQLEKKDPF
jgi:hypothetical protein